MEKRREGGWIEERGKREEGRERGEKGGMKGEKKEGRKEVLQCMTDNAPVHRLTGIRGLRNDTSAIYAVLPCAGLSLYPSIPLSLLLKHPHSSNSLFQQWQT